MEDEIEWSTERAGVPGKLTFKVHLDSKLDITEGNAVRFRWNGSNVFYGFIFSKKMSKDRVITVTAYDQLRYLKNKDTYVYENKTAAELIRMAIYPDLRSEEERMQYEDFLMNGLDRVMSENDE